MTRVLDAAAIIDGSHESVVYNGADGNDGIWLTCRSCGWTSEDFHTPAVAALVGEAEAHKVEARRTEEGSAASIRAKFIQALVALGFRQTNAAGETMALDHSTIRAWVGWEKVSLATIEHGRCLHSAGWTSFDEALAYLGRLRLVPA